MLPAIDHIRSAARYALCCLLFAACALPARADGPPGIHGHSDAFAGQGIAIAWGILRGATEQTTKVVLKIIADPSRYESIAMDGEDPFTGTRQTIFMQRPSKGTIDLRIPRSQYADLPRTELRFFTRLGQSQPMVIVYYVGVPDTTPEFADEAKLEAFLTERVTRLAQQAKQP